MGHRIHIYNHKQVSNYVHIHILSSCNVQSCQPSVEKCLTVFFTVGSFGVKVHEKNCCGFRDKENDKSVSAQTINCLASIFPTSSFTIDPVNQGEIFTLEEILSRSITKLCKYLKERHGYQVCSNAQVFSILVP